MLSSCIAQPKMIVFLQKQPKRPLITSILWFTVVVDDLSEYTFLIVEAQLQII